MSVTAPVGILVGLMRRIVFYTGEAVQPWGPDSLYSGIGGSEEALILISSQLAALGWSVEVFGEPPGGALERDGVRWAPYDTFDPDRSVDVFVAWREARFVERARAARVTCHWLHNMQVHPYPREAGDRVDRILLLSRFHRARWPDSEVSEEKIWITRNGLDPRFLRPPGDNQPHRIIYASCPARGLSVLLDLWPKLKRLVPEAELDVYYGFTPIYEMMTEHFPGLAYIKADILARIQQPGINFYGMVGQDRLAEGFAQAGVWAYPTETEETSCITAMKALAMGCVPVTSGFGVLPETLGGVDFGPVHPTKKISESRWRRRVLLHRLVRAIRQGGTDEVRGRRLRWAGWARKHYDWAVIAASWSKMFEDMLRGKTEETDGIDGIVGGISAGSEAEVTLRDQAVG